MAILTLLQQLSSPPSHPVPSRPKMNSSHEYNTSPESTAKAQDTVIIRKILYYYCRGDRNTIF